MWKLLLMLYCVLTLSGCEKPQVTAGPSGTTAARQKITFALTTQPQSTLVHIALKNGYFSDQGLDVQPLVHSFGKAALQSLLDGKANFATVAETPIMFSILRGERIFVVANIESSTTNNAEWREWPRGLPNPPT